MLDIIHNNCEPRVLNYYAQIEGAIGSKHVHGPSANLAINQQQFVQTSPNWVDMFNKAVETCPQIFLKLSNRG